MDERLPRGIEWLLRLGVPADLREPIAGDLLEEHGRRRQGEGPVRAHASLWCQAARLAWRFRWERTIHGRGLPPIGDEIRRAGMWDSIRQDVAFGARMLRRQPGFTAVALLAIALGIGANTAIFSVVDAALWRPLPYPGSNDVISLGERRTRENRIHGPVAPADFYDWRRENRAFSAMAGLEPGAVNITGGAEPERVRAVTATAGFLDVLGIKPRLGRDVMRDEETQGRHRVVLLSDGFWRRRFGGNPSIVSGKITLNGNPYEVAGALPESFWWPSGPDLILLYPLPGQPTRAVHSMEVIARLRPGVSLEQARAEMDAIGRRLSEQYPETNATHFPHLAPLQQTMVGDIRPALLVLLAAVGIVLLIACVNVATLLLAKAASRQCEIAVRLAIGAGRGRLVRQLLTESVMLAAIGGAVGVLIAAWGVNAFRATAPASFGALPGIAHVGIDSRVLVVAVVLSAVAGVVFGIVPALASSDRGISSALREESRGGTSGARSSRLRAVLVVAELALSLILLIGAGLLLASFRHVLDVSPGFEPRNLVVASIARSGTLVQARAFYDELLERLRAAPAVDAAAVATPLPLDAADGRASFGIEGRTGESPIPVRARPRVISPGYFATLQIPVLDGRAFTDRDIEGSPYVVILNAAAVRRYWPNENPLGRRITFFSNDRWFEIVGIVGDVKHAGLEQDTDPEAYLPYRQLPFGAMGQRLSLVVRTRSGLAAMAPIIRSVVSGLDRNQPVGTISAMEDVIAESVAPRRLGLGLVVAFAVVALALTSACVYGVMSYLVAQRTREIGVRMAFGASPRRVLVLVLRQVGRLAAIGIALGFAGALALTRLMTSLLFGVSPTEPLVYVGVATILVAVTLAAVAVPSSRAARVDPIVALRES